MKVIKVDDSIQEFSLEKIENAIRKASDSVDDISARLTADLMTKVLNTVLKKLEGYTSINVNDINDFVEQSLVRHNKWLVSRAYITGREEKSKRDKFTPTEKKFMSIINGTSELRGDNANKRIDDNGSVRDYGAGLLCKSIADKTLPKEVIKANEDGWLHFHDKDYSPVLKLHNCFLPSQKFITDKGVRMFKEFNDGEGVYVKDIFGNTRYATVHKYEPQIVKEYIFKSSNGVKKSVFATTNHRWYLNNGTVTDNIQVGDKLIKLTFTQDVTIDNAEDAKIWCLGFIIGDGCDHGTFTQVRLCGNKNKYLDIFKQSNIFKLSETKNGDSLLYTKWLNKQNFLNGKCWEILTTKQKALLFKGLYAADGRTLETSISSSDERIINLIECCAGMANYFITSKIESYHDTNYKKNAYLCTFRFLTLPQRREYSWKLDEIKPYNKNRKVLVYCITEPETHSFMLENGIPTGNCDVLNIEDMLTNGFAMMDCGIFPNDETPFRTAANIMSLINEVVSGRQYGGQTVTWSHIVKFVNQSREEIRKKVYKDLKEYKNITTEEF